MSAPHGFSEPSPGGHVLPAHIASAFPQAPRPRKRRTGLLIGIIGALVAVAVVGALQITANLGYDDTRAEFDGARETAQDTIAEVTLSSDRLVSASDTATLLLDSDSGVLADPTAKEALAASITEAADTSASADQVLDTALPDEGLKPVFFWELFGASEGLRLDIQDLEDLDSELAEESPALAEAETLVTDAGLAFLGSAATAAASFEAAHVSAKNDDVIALRDAASTAAGASALDDSAVTTFVALQDAAAQVVASESAELSEKAGPLQGVRLEIEAYARSLAPGVLLEFDWNQIVNNAGENGSMGGLTTWWWDEPDRAVIELSNSVAEQWPADRSKALVAHEVGHAISVKCEDMYDSSTQDSIEKWATAWAISMGFTDDANGVWAYGYPPQSYIDAAAGCR